MTGECQPSGDQWSGGRDQPGTTYPESARTSIGLQAREPGEDPTLLSGEDSVREPLSFCVSQPVPSTAALISGLILRVPFAHKDAREGDEGCVLWGSGEFVILLLF